MMTACLALASCKELGLGASTPDGKQQVLARDMTERGYKRLTENKAEEALSLFNQALVIDQTNPRTLQGKGIALANLGKYSEAEGMYKDALKLDPQSVSIKNNLAMTQILQGDYKEAIELLAPLAEKEPVNPTVRQNLALANCLSGKRDEARTLYSKDLTAAEIEDNLRFCNGFEKIRKQ